MIASLYEGIRKTAYAQRRSISGVAGGLVEQFRAGDEKELAEYRKIKNNEKKG